MVRDFGQAKRTNAAALDRTYFQVNSMMCRATIMARTTTGMASMNILHEQSTIHNTTTSSTRSAVARAGPHTHEGSMGCAHRHQRRQTPPLVLWAGRPSHHCRAVTSRRGQTGSGRSGTSGGANQTAGPTRCARSGDTKDMRTRTTCWRRTGWAGSTRVP